MIDIGLVLILNKLLCHWMSLIYSLAYERVTSMLLLYA
jgi:hypothetical protein